MILAAGLLALRRCAPRGAEIASRGRLWAGVDAAGGHVAKIVVPAALSGIVAAFLLAISRAIGETMAVALAAGSTPKLTIESR